MKKLIYGGLFLALVGMVLVGCQKDTSYREANTDGSNKIEKNPNNEDVEKSMIDTVNFGESTSDVDIWNKAFSLAKGKDIHVHCSGTCDCTLQGTLSPKKVVVNCTCDDCVMQITFESNIAKVFNVDGNLQVPGLHNYLDFAKNNYDLRSIDLWKKNNYIIARFNYNDSGTDGSVMYKISTNKTYQIDCTGGCGCKEVYDFSTNKASCSCADCVMNVTVVQSYAFSMSLLN